MLICKLLLIASLLAGLVLGQDASSKAPATEVTTVIPTMTTERPPPRGFWKRMFYMLGKMFQENKKQNEVNANELSQMFNRSLTELSDDVNKITDKIKDVSKEFGDLSSLKDPNKDMIGKVLTLLATGVSVFASSLTMGNNGIQILNDVYQGVARVGDKLYDMFQRNSYNFQAMASYVPDETVKKVLEIYVEFVKVMEKIKAIMVATMNQIQIIYLQQAVKYASRGIPLHVAVVTINKNVSGALKMIVDLLQGFISKTRAILKGISDTTTGAIKKTVDTTSQVFRNIFNKVQGLRRPPQSQPAATSANPTTGAKEATEGPTTLKQ